MTPLFLDPEGTRPVDSSELVVGQIVYVKLPISGKLIAMVVRKTPIS